MPRLAANLSFLFTEVAFLDRFERAARCGFRGVEFLFPYEHPASLIRQRCEGAGVEVALFNAPAGNWSAGERGLACRPDRAAEFRASITRALTYCAEIGCSRLHVLAGLCADLDRQRASDRYVENLAYAADMAAAVGVTITIEPLNRFDVPGYLLRTTTEAEAILRVVDRSNIGLQLDLYHTQISEGDLARRIRHLLPVIRHVQLAGVPGRHEPDDGEINPHFLLELLDAAGYRDWVGCEYQPRHGTKEGLRWAAPYLRPTS